MIYFSPYDPTVYYEGVARQDSNPQVRNEEGMQDPSLTSMTPLLEDHHDNDEEMLFISDYAQNSQRSSSPNTLFFEELEYTRTLTSSNPDTPGFSSLTSSNISPRKETSAAFDRIVTPTLYNNTPSPFFSSSPETRSSHSSIEENNSSHERSMALQNFERETVQNSEEERSSPRRSTRSNFGSIYDNIIQGEILNTLVLELSDTDRDSKLKRKITHLQTLQEEVKQLKIENEALKRRESEGTNAYKEKVEVYLEQLRYVLNSSQCSSAHLQRFLGASSQESTIEKIKEIMRPLLNTISVLEQSGGLLLQENKLLLSAIETPTNTSFSDSSRDNIDRLF
jgi:hypothetical protein